MEAIVLWALAIGVITGGVWVGIVLQRRQWEQQPLLHQELRNRLDGLQDLERRLADVEARLQFPERMLAKERDERRLAALDAAP
jgi:hypothetical protein